ncbi:hypothetical protein MNBD_ALPHA11-1983 [hydrothermal vent metagenome]|uniref:Uncharacterized protein n=1 Tax=hydrothermal vent metagenome TaxID=652676 RepID=A0A3B0TKK2_9ZZZZ
MEMLVKFNFEPIGSGLMFCSPTPSITKKPPQKGMAFLMAGGEGLCRG